MKKFIFCLMLFAFCFSITCFATDELSISGVEGTETADNVIEIDDPDEALDIYEGNYSQSDMKNYYREYLKFSREEDAKRTVNETVKAKVIDVYDVETIYNMYYYTPYKISYQPIVIEILEGKYKGEKIDTQYALTADTFENIVVSELKVGDRIFVNISEEEDGELYVETATYDVSVQRFGWIIALLIIAAIVIIACFGIKGVQNLLLIGLIAAMIFGIALPVLSTSNKTIIIENSSDEFPSLKEIEEDPSIAILEKDNNGNPSKVEIVIKNNNFIWITLISIVVIAAVNIINHVGLGKKAIYAFGVTICMILIATILLFVVEHVTNINGNGFEASIVAENLINKNANFNSLYFLTVLIIATVLISNLVSEIIDKDYDKKGKEVLAKQMNIIAVFAIMLMLPKFFTLNALGYSLKEILNSEMLQIEVIRMLILMISVSLTIPLTEIIKEKINTVKATEEVEKENN